MTKFYLAMKTIFYFVSIIMPIKDAVKGVISGVRDGIKEKEFEKEVRDIYEYIRTETDINFDDEVNK